MTLFDESQILQQAQAFCLLRLGTQKETLLELLQNLRLLEFRHRTPVDIRMFANFRALCFA